MGLSSAEIIEHGVDVAERDGLAAVAVRSVAGEAGVTPMALYRHVEDAAALRAAVVERLVADLPLPLADGTWDERCRQWAHGARVVLSRAPGLAGEVLLTWVHLPRVLLALDGLVALLERDGPPGVDAVAGANAVLTHVLMRAQAEESLRAGGTRRDLGTMRAMRSAVPTLWAHREEYRVALLDDHFAYGLDATLAGLAIAGRSTRPGAPTT